MQNTLKYSILYFFALLASSSISFSQTNPNSNLPKLIRNCLKGFDGQVGVGVLGLDFRDTILINEDAQYPMQSVYKLPLAIYILHRVDQGELRLDQQVPIVKSKLEQDTWSPMLNDFKSDTFSLSVSQLLLYSVSKSDNNACDLLFELADGPRRVQQYFTGLSITQMAIAATEAEMHANWEAQYTNWCRPSAMLQILSGVYEERWLKSATNQFLMKLLTESENSPNRIKGKLPKNAIVAHKTGTGNVDKKGMRTATNDVAIITLPNDKHYALVVYLSNYRDDIKKGEALIADISKAVWDYYSK